MKWNFDNLPFEIRHEIFKFLDKNHFDNNIDNYKFNLLLLNDGIQNTYNNINSNEYQIYLFNNCDLQYIHRFLFTFFNLNHKCDLCQGFKFYEINKFKKLKIKELKILNNKLKNKLHLNKCNDFINYKICCEYIIKYKNYQNKISYLKRKQKKYITK